MAIALAAGALLGAAAAGSIGYATAGASGAVIGASIGGVAGLGFGAAAYALSRPPYWYPPQYPGVPGFCYPAHPVPVVFFPRRIFYTYA